MKSINQIIVGLESVAEHAEVMSKTPGWSALAGTYREEASLLREAVAKLRTHPDAQPNEPLRWRSCKREKPTKKGRYEVVCRNGDIPPYVLLGFYNPDNPGWDLYGVTHWRPLPEPPKEEK